MKTSLLFTMVPVSLLTLASASNAFASDNPCGQFDFSGGAKCEIKVSGGCETECKPLQFQATCNASCASSFDVTCATTCQAKCIADCKPGSVDCKSSCNGECQSICSSECNHGDCSSAAEASCASECETSCVQNPPTCDVSCQKSCEGACTAAANINCNVDCYSKLEGGCETECQKPSGALFCNGQYVSADDVDACISYIENNLHGSVDVSARGQVSCDLAKGCEGSGSTSGCSVSQAGTGGSTSHAGALGALALLGLSAGVFARRQRGARPRADRKD